MCLFNISNIETLKEDTYFYKIVTTTLLDNKTFTSMLNPEERSAQSLPFLLGESLTYEINVPIESSFNTTEGMYCFVKEDEVRQHLPFYLNSSKINKKVLTVFVPKGTRVKWAYYYTQDYNGDPYPKSPDSVLVEKLIPISVLPEKKLK